MPEATLAPALPTPGEPPPVSAPLTLVEGAPALLSRIEARHILDAAERGMDALLVSGDNRLDAYGLLAQARVRGLEDAVADGLVLARAFTVHQFAALVEETLPRMAQGRRPAVALVTGLLEPFRDEDVRPAEARILLRRVLRTLDAWGASSGVPVVATYTPGALADVARGTGLPHARAAPAPLAAWTLDRFAEVA